MNKTVVAVIVYKRLENIKIWLDCWSKCNKNADFVVIHNYDKKEHQDPFKRICKDHGVKYVPRLNKGFDIGAMQDFIKSDLAAGYDNMIWITDDTIPMDLDFVSKFTKHLEGNIGITCLEISSIRSPLHVRTTGFCMKMSTAKKLVFPKSITTKEDCYHFEHRGGKMTMMQQVLSMGMRSVQIAPPEKSVLWDIGNRSHFNRWAEHREVFSDKPEQKQLGDKVIIMCPVYHNYPQIVSSLIAQTHQNWELHLIHDGDGKIELPNDKRIFFEATKERVGNYGHALRAEYLQKLKDKGDYIIISNVDNYYMPVFLERAITSFKNTPNAVATYCSQIIHNYTDWGVMNCRLERGYIDCGQVVLKAKEAALVGWNSLDHSADWFFFNDVANKYGRNSFVPFKGCLFVHN